MSNDKIVYKFKMFMLRQIAIKTCNNYGHNSQAMILLYKARNFM